MDAERSYMDIVTREGWEIPPEHKELLTLKNVADVLSKVGLTQTQRERFFTMLNEIVNLGDLPGADYSSTHDDIIRAFSVQLLERVFEIDYYNLSPVKRREIDDFIKEVAGEYFQ